jgi:starvation-inducible DNA-binding protein
MKARSFVTRNDLSPQVRSAIAILLNQHLADLSDLRSQVKVAHWNVKGGHFIAYHKLFDELAEGLDEAIDDVGERITALGYLALGTVRDAASQSRLLDFEDDRLDGLEVIKQLADRYSVLGKFLREDIDKATELGDAGTADLLTGLSREFDKSLYFLEATLN